MRLNDLAGKLVPGLAMATGLLLACAPGCSRKAEGSAQQPAAQAVSRTKEVKTLPLAGEAFREALDLRGTALADKSSILNSEVGGVVSEILVERGDHVKEGQVLVRFDKQSLSLGVQQALAGVQAAEVQAKQVGTELVRTKTLVADGAAPGAALDQLSAAGDATGAQVRMAKAAAGQARHYLKVGDIRAPYDGVITEIFIERGEMASVMPPKPVVQLADISKLQVQAFAPEDSGQLAVIGAEAEVEVESAGVTAKGAVTYVASAIQPGVRTFEIRIGIDNLDEKIKANALARVRILGPESDAAILVPMGAVLRDESDAPYVFVAENNVARKKPVKLGPSQGARVLVREGLNAGELLVVEGAGELSEGQPIATTVR
jgi:membrane fusion protein, multidrug efflux system